MNRFINPHAGYPQPMQQPVQQAPQQMPQQFQQPLMGGPVPYNPQMQGMLQPMYQQMPQQYQQPAQYAPQMMPGMMPQQMPQQYQQPAQYAPQMMPGNMGYPQQMQRGMNMGPQMFQQPNLPQQNFLQPAQQPGYQQEVNTSSNRFQTPEPSQVQVQQPQTTIEGKSFMPYVPAKEPLIDLQGVGFKLDYKQEPINTGNYQIAEDLEVASNLENAIDSTIECLVSTPQADMCSKVVMLADEYYGVDMFDDIKNIVGSHPVDKVAQALTATFKNVKTKYELVVLNEFNDNITTAINSLLHINFKEVINIDSFKDDYIELVSYLINCGSNELADKVRGVVDTCDRVYNCIMDIKSSGTIDDTESLVPVTKLYSCVSVTAINAMVKETKLDVIPVNVPLHVINAYDTKYIYSIFKAVNDNLINSNKSIKGDVENCSKHYLVTLDKRVFELIWSIDGNNTYITRLS